MDGRSEDASRVTPELARRESKIYWYSVVSGWAAAFGAGLLLSAPVTGVLLMISELEVPEATRILGWTGASGVAFLAFLYGGYISGGLSRHSGLKHGLSVPLLNLMAASSLALFVLVSGVCIKLARRLFGAGLLSAEIEQGMSLLKIPSPYILVPLLLSFLGGALGGAWGARSGYLNSRNAQKRERELIEAMRAR